MKKTIFFIASFLLLISCSQETNTVESTTTTTTTIKLEPVAVDIRMTSTAISKNLLGESGNQMFHVWLPPSYSTSTKNYPVLYF